MCLCILLPAHILLNTFILTMYIFLWGISSSLNSFVDNVQERDNYFQRVVGIRVPAHLQK